jgi:hypothetical protein
MSVASGCHFQKNGIRFIAAAMNDSYYKCLLQLQDLIVVASLTHEELCKQSASFFMGLLRQAKRPWEDTFPDEMLPVDDAGDTGSDADEKQCRGRAPPALEDIVGGYHGGANLSEELRTMHFGSLKISFSTSHSSGIPRGYIQCPNKDHKRCFRYRQINMAPDRPTLLAYLLAWSTYSLTLHRDEHSDSKFQPGEDDIASAKLEFGL